MNELQATTLDLLHRHHRQNRLVVDRRGGPTSAAWNSVWGNLREIREAASGGDASCRDWLALHGSLITAVEAVRKVELDAAVTYRGPRR